MRPKGSAAELETRRRLAGRLLLEGRKIGEVAQIVAASVSSVRRWRQAVKKGGLDALKFHVNYHPAHVWRILRGLGWTPQKPEQRAPERNEADIRRWRAEAWPRI